LIFTRFREGIKGDVSSKHKTKTKTGDIWKMSSGTNNELYAKTTDNPKA
jgi:hypothetical protein